MRQGSGSDQVAQSWSTTATYTWTPAIAASYTVTVWARSAGVTTDAAQAAAQLNYSVTAASGPLSITSLTSNVASPQMAGTTVTFSAGGVGRSGSVPLQVVGIRRFHMEGRAGLGHERHVQLAADDGRRLHGGRLGSEQGRESQCQRGACPGVLQGYRHGVDSTVVDHEFHQQPGKPAGDRDDDYIPGGGHWWRGTLSIQVVGVQTVRRGEWHRTGTRAPHSHGGRQRQATTWSRSGCGTTT